MKRIIMITFLLAEILIVSATTKRALVVGISDYPSLNYLNARWSSANDARMMQKTLRQQGFKVSVLTDNNATAAKIRKALQNLQTESCKGDLVYIHFSCHGQPVEDRNGDETGGMGRDYHTV